MKKIEKWGAKSLAELAEKHWHNVKDDIYSNIIEKICTGSYKECKKLVYIIINSLENWLIFNKKTDIFLNSLIKKIEDISYSDTFSDFIKKLATSFEKLNNTLDLNNIKSFIIVFKNKKNAEVYKKSKEYKNKTLVVSDLVSSISFLFDKLKLIYSIDELIKLLIKYITDQYIGNNATDKKNMQYFLINAKEIIISNEPTLNTYIINNLSNNLIKILPNIFKYNKTNREKLTELLYNNKSSLLACPYCNTNYISAMPIEGDKSKFFFELDHFYNQSTYPYLGLSFYNLIPACHTCNATLKLDKNFSIKTHIHPYVDDFDSIARFSLPLTKENLQQFLVPNSSIKVEDTDTEAQKEAKKLKIKLVQKGSEEDFQRAKHNEEDFLLEKRYELHQDYINEILIKAYAYPDDYLESIQKTFPKLFEGAGSTEQMKRLIWGNYTQPEDINRRPLAKLTQDIMDELGLNK